MNAKQFRQTLAAPDADLAPTMPAAGEAPAAPTMPAAAPATPGPALFNREGASWREAGRDAKGRPFYRYKSICGRCSNHGGPGWHPSGLNEGRCYSCGGHGGPVKAAPLYTADKLAKLNATKAKADARRAAKLQAVADIARADADARRAAFEAANADFMPWLRAQAEAEGASEFILSLAGQASAKAALSPAQCEAVRNAKARAEAATAARAASRHVGNVGERLTLPVSVVRTFQFYRKPAFGYGRFDNGATEAVQISTMRDANGNALVVMSPAFTPKRGDAFTLRATVKEHKDYKGEAQTLLNRAAIIGEVTPAADAPATGNTTEG